jgi:hypothetical protein
MNNLNYIHVGYPKCASSFLQMDIFSKDERIKFHGIIRDPDSSKSVKINPIIRKFILYARGKTNIAPKSEDLIRIMSGNVNVISDEDFSTYGNIAIENKVERIKNILPSAKIIIVVRSPISLLRSFYDFYFRGGHIKIGLNDFFNKEFENYEESTILQTAHYKRCISCFVEEFGSENVYVLNLDDLKHNSNNFLLSLYKIMGLKYIKPKKDIKKRNVALPGSALNFGVKFPSVWNIRKYFPKFIRRLIKYICTKINSKPESFSASNIKRINRFYIDDIQYLENKYSIFFKD